jgi:predicted ATPase
MTLHRIDIQGYRSLRNVTIELGRLNVVTGPNGSGKSNLYRALWLIGRICEGNFARSMCDEGGLLSTMWAGPRLSDKKPVRMTLGFQIDELRFQMSCGFPGPSPSRFCFDPEIKEEVVWLGRQRRPSTTLLERSAGNTWIREVSGERVDYPLELDPNESVLAQLREPHRYPELSSIREAVKGWRFYHTFRTDDDAPLRHPKVSVRSPVLDHDGGNLAAAIQTIGEIGDWQTMGRVIAAALPGRAVEILSNEADPRTKSPRYTELSLGLRTEGCVRPLLARELSDGTLKFLCLTACLLSPRPPAMLALNEPEASLHPDLIGPLAMLIAQAANYSQVWVSTHSQALAEQLTAQAKAKCVTLALHAGETIADTEHDVDADAD